MKKLLVFANSLFVFFSFSQERFEIKTDKALNEVSFLNDGSLVINFITASKVGKTRGGYTTVEPLEKEKMRTDFYKINKGKVQNSASDQKIGSFPFKDEMTYLPYKNNNHYVEDKKGNRYVLKFGNKETELVIINEDLSSKSLFVKDPEWRYRESYMPFLCTIVNDTMVQWIDVDGGNIANKKKRGAYLEYYTYNINSGKFSYKYVKTAYVDPFYRAHWVGFQDGCPLFILDDKEINRIKIYKLSDDQITKYATYAPKYDEARLHIYKMQVLSDPLEGPKNGAFFCIGFIDQKKNTMDGMRFVRFQNEEFEEVNYAFNPQTEVSPSFPRVYYTQSGDKYRVLLSSYNQGGPGRLCSLTEKVEDKERDCIPLLVDFEDLSLTPVSNDFLDFYTVLISTQKDYYTGNQDKFFSILGLSEQANAKILNAVENYSEEERNKLYFNYLEEKKVVQILKIQKNQDAYGFELTEVKI